MSAVKKRHKPANDHYTYSSQRMPYVALPRPYWNRQRMGVVALLASFVLLLCLAVAANMQVAPAEKMPIAAQKISAPKATQAVEPYDITINASELAPSENENGLATGAEAIPVIVIRPQGDARQHALPPVLEISVDEDEAEQVSPQRQAELKASAARVLARQGDVTQALRLQHRAVELAPSNMLYRLDLAILYDRAGERDGAVALYQQVVQAYDAQDTSLPHSLGIEDIRRRLGYLASRGS
jgi:tetratricopeptide (TPR) repeat protein